jgi:hypothetical protein
MRKVYLTVEAEAQVPVKVRLNVCLRVDEDANLQAALRQLGRHSAYSKTDVEHCDIEALGILDDDPRTDDFDWSAVVQQIPFKVTDFTVQDSK